MVTCFTFDNLYLLVTDSTMLTTHSQLKQVYRVLGLQTNT